MSSPLRRIIAGVAPDNDSDGKDGQKVIIVVFLFEDHKQSQHIYFNLLHLPIMSLIFQPLSIVPRLPAFILMPLLLLLVPIVLQTLPILPLIVLPTPLLLVLLIALILLLPILLLLPVPLVLILTTPILLLPITRCRLHYRCA
jgi:hypothetical protein